MKAGGNEALALPEAWLGESVNGEFKAVYDMPDVLPQDKRLPKEWIVSSSSVVTEEV